MNATLSLPEEQAAKGMVVHSSGNHAAAGLANNHLGQKRSDHLNLHAAELSSPEVHERCSVLVRRASNIGRGGPQLWRSRSYSSTCSQETRHTCSSYPARAQRGLH